MVIVATLTGRMGWKRKYRMIWKEIQELIAVQTGKSHQCISRSLSAQRKPKSIVQVK
jgi:hypothetical protein